MKKNIPFNLLNREIKEIKKSLDIISKFGIKNFDKLCLDAHKAIKSGNKIIFFGNGGSASDAQHLAAELVVKYKKKRKPISAISLSTDTSIITSISNDFDYKNVFSRQIEAIGKKNDIALAITTSGNSNNLIEAIKTANKLKLKTFCFSGNNGGRLKRFVSYPILLPGKITSVTQVLEITIGQVLCEYLESQI